MIARLYWQVALTAALVSTLMGTQLEAQPQPCPAPHVVTDNRFKPGDVWTYQTRPEEPESTLTILRVETREKTGVIVHIRLDGLHLHNGTGSLVDTIQHLPFTRQSLADSVMRKKGGGPVPDFTDGYIKWSIACGGVYTISVRDVVAADQMTLLYGSRAR